MKGEAGHSFGGPLSASGWGLSFYQRSAGCLFFVCGKVGGERGNPPLGCRQSSLQILVCIDVFKLQGTHNGNNKTQHNQWDSCLGPSRGLYRHRSCMPWVSLFKDISLRAVSLPLSVIARVRRCIFGSGRGS